jgi:hypothetical protein
MSSIASMPSLERQRPGFTADEIALDYRERLALEALERAALKRQDLAEQSAAQNSAGMRIRAWEKVHQLRMPSTPFHPVLQAIALATQLTLAEVRYEQQLRSGRRASAEL